MKPGIIRKLTGLLLLVILFSAPFYPPVKNILHIPDHIKMFEGQSFEIPSSVTVLSHEGAAVETDKSTSALKSIAPSAGTVNMGVKGFPVKAADVSIYPKLKLIPGGQSIGVRVKTDGVLVVGYHLLDTDSGKVSPGEAAGIQTGDSIIKINGEMITDTGEIQPVVNKAGRNNHDLTFEIKRNGKLMKKKVKPVKAVGKDQYHLGLYIRDSAAGVGTLTFYDPVSLKYGALGHVISDMETKKPIEIGEGEIIRSDVTSIEKGLTGEPGEKLARLSNDRKVLGSIKRNTDFGIFGKLNDKVKREEWIEPMEIGLAQHIEEGKAEILTVVEGEEVKRFDIEIVSSTPQSHPATKGMVIKVTDEELLEKTGGIVQGMSGSPIIQNNKIIGAVTHVFVNDPSTGYGCHIEWMLKDAGIQYRGQLEEAS